MDEQTTNQPLDAIADPLARRIVGSFSDLAMVVDSDGLIAEISVGGNLESHPGWGRLVGRPWKEVVMRDSLGKVESLSAEAATGQTQRSREINLRVEGLGDIPFRFSGVKLDDTSIIAFGLDIRPLADLQQRMVSGQQLMELEYERVRQSEAQYRILFHVTSEAVLYARGDELTVTDANPAAVKLLRQSSDAMRGKPLQSLFAGEPLSELLEAGAADRPVEVELRPANDPEVELGAVLHMFRQGGNLVALLRARPKNGEGIGDVRDERILTALEALPDGFVITARDFRILSANASFCEMVERATERQVVGEPLDRWLGRPNVDLNIIAKSLSQHDILRDFSTIIRGELGSEQGVTVTAVSVPWGAVPCFAFVIHPVYARIEAVRTGPIQTRSPDELRKLVGRMSLRDIVQESADLIERLCIEAALELSSSNRAAAAQLLGLSRQSLYAKLKRHGLEDYLPS